MSQENVEIVRRFFADAESGEWNTDLLAANVEFVPASGSLLTAVRGAERFEREIAEIAAHFDDYVVLPQRFHHGGDVVVAELHRRARTPRGSLPIDDRFAQVFTFRDGRIVRIQSFGSVVEALEAAGLSE